MPEKRIDNCKSEQWTGVQARELENCGQAKDIAGKHFYTGKILQASGEHEKAIMAFKTAIKLNSGIYGAHRFLGLSLEMLGKFDEALYCYQQSLQSNPTDPNILYYIGNIYNKMGEPGRALKAYQKAISLAPDFAEALNHMAIIYRNQGLYQQAMELCRKSLSIRPDSAEIHNNAGNIQCKLGNQQAALQFYQTAVELKPSLWEAHYNIGSLLKIDGQLEPAIKAYRLAILHKPDFYQAMNGLGDAYRVQGDHDAAMSAYENALAVNNQCVASYRYMTVIRKYTKKDRYIVGMESLLSSPELNPSDRIALNFALGKAHEDLRQYDVAFRYLAEGNRIKRTTFNYDEIDNSRLFANIKKAFTKTFLKNRSGWGKDDATPIFIIGMPRSGTSLVEQILSSHPDVHGAGELSNLDRILSTYGKRILKRTYPAFSAKLTRNDCLKMGTAYIEGIRKLNRHGTFITDKMPQNFLFAGLIKIILPKAKIIHCVRNPMDTCFSIFKNDFSRLHPYAYDLNEIGGYYQLYQGLMRHWHRVMPDFIHDVHYEKITAEPEKQVRRLLNCCGLQWNDQCMMFHRSRRPVLTASTAQVRRPIYRDSVELWKNYEQDLQPLIKKNGV